MKRIVIGLNPGVWGMNYHDTAACLLIDGQLVAAAEEERYCRIKSAPQRFPRDSVRRCLDFAGCGASDVHSVAVGYSPGRWKDRLALELQSALGRHLEANTAEMAVTSARLDDYVQTQLHLRDRAALFADEDALAQRLRGLLQLTGDLPVQFVDHHLAHAATAFHPTSFSEALILVADGVGEYECMTAWRADAHRLERIESQHLPNSLGYWYAAFTEYLGFAAFEGEGKTMALAPYGSHDRGIDSIVGSTMHCDENGYECGHFVRPLLGVDLSLDTERAVKALELLFGFQRRRAGAPLEQRHKNIAWSVQRLLEVAMSGLVRRLCVETGMRNVGFAGGVALNCKLNQVLRELREIDRLYVSPVSSDAGLAYGASLVVAQNLGDDVRRPLVSLALGPSRGDDVASLLAEWQIPCAEVDDVSVEVAQALAQGEIVLWLHGRSEIGPRALGSRSILSDPRDASLGKKVNRVVKEREDWRPFGPSVMEEHVDEVVVGYDKTERGGHMIQTYRVSGTWRDIIPAAVHPVDGTMRPHVVSRLAQPDYWKVISAFKQRTGVPLVVNTSFNGRDEPLVETLKDAVRLFWTSAADMLVIDAKYVVRKQRA